MMERPIYPGHPLTVAFVIADLYPDLDTASALGSLFPAALEDVRVPGAGGNVFGALVLLQSLRDGRSGADVILWADESWAHCDDQRDSPAYRARWEAGQHQADALKPRIGELVAWAAHSPMKRSG